MFNQCKFSGLVIGSPDQGVEDLILHIIHLLTSVLFLLMSF